jgi:hypothetical protein
MSAALSLAGCISKNTVPFFINNADVVSSSPFFFSAGWRYSSLLSLVKIAPKKQNLAREDFRPRDEESIFSLEKVIQQSSLQRARSIYDNSRFQRTPL